MGLVHVFLFLNVKDGPSRFRMASFYAVRLLCLIPMPVFPYAVLYSMCTTGPSTYTHRCTHTHTQADSLHRHPHLRVQSSQWRKSVCRWLMVWPSPLLQFMLVENATLLLAASDFLSEASWDSMTLPTTVLCSFLLGESLSLSALSLFWSKVVFSVIMCNVYN